jgi:hypothetical protein
VTSNFDAVDERSDELTPPEQRVIDHAGTHALRVPCLAPFVEAAAGR